MKTRETWAEEKIKAQILEMVEDTKLGRMPTSTEIREYYGDNKLASAISRRRMWRPLAEEMGLRIKNSDTEVGKTYEFEMERVLKNRGHEVEQMRQNYPYDLLVDRYIKVDIKAAKMYEGPNGNFYTYGIGKPQATCDLYILLQIGFDNEIEETYIIPSKYVHDLTQISIGEYNSKYHKYRNRWDYLDEYKKFYDRL